MIAYSLFSLLRTCLVFKKLYVCYKQYWQDKIKGIEQVTLTSKSDPYSDSIFYMQEYQSTCKEEARRLACAWQQMYY